MPNNTARDKVRYEIRVHSTPTPIIKYEAIPPKLRALHPPQAQAVQFLASGQPRSQIRQASAEFAPLGLLELPRTRRRSGPHTCVIHAQSRAPYYRHRAARLREWRGVRCGRSKDDGGRNEFPFYVGAQVKSTIGRAKVKEYFC